MIFMVMTMSITVMMNLTSSPRKVRRRLILYLIKGSQTSGKTSSTPTVKLTSSWVWHFGREKLEKGTSEWVCDTCHNEGKWFTYRSHSSTWIGKHLREQHSILRTSAMKPTKPRMFDGKAPNRNITELLEAHSTKIENFKRHLTIWVCVDRQAFTCVQHPVFVQAIRDLSPEAASQIPKSANTVRNWILKEFEKQHDFLKEKLQLAKSRIHLSMDLWSTPSGNRSYLGIVAHWVDENNEVREVLIALPDLKGEHSGLNIAETALKVIEDYDIGSKVGFYMLDNAKNNDTGISHLQRLLKEKHGNDCGILSPKDARLRCLGHVLNLAAKALLFGKDADQLEYTTEDPSAEEEAEFEKWRKSGAIGKCHNLVIFLYASGQRRDHFRDIQTKNLNWDHSIMPHKPNATRWNSYFLMMNDILNLREAVEVYYTMVKNSPAFDRKDKKKLDDYCKLTDEDWNELIEIHAMLYDFWDVTMKMQGNVANEMRDDPELAAISKTVYGKQKEKVIKSRSFSEDGALFNVLPAYEHVLHKLETAKNKYVSNNENH